MELLRRRLKSTESTTFEIGASRDRLHKRVVTLNGCAADMFVAMYSASCSFGQACLRLVGSRIMYRQIPLRMSDLEQSVSELLSDVMCAFGPKRSLLMERAALEKAVASAEQ